MTEERKRLLDYILLKIGVPCISYPESIVRYIKKCIALAYKNDVSDKRAYVLNLVSKRIRSKNAS